MLNLLLTNFLSSGSPEINDIGLSLLMVAARHKTERHMRTYILDCVSRWESTQLDRFAVGNSVSRWRSIGPIKDTEIENVPITPDTVLKKDLPELADWWFRTVVRFPSTAVLPNSKTLLEYALSVRGQLSNKPESAATADSTASRVAEVFENSIMTTEEKKALCVRLLSDLQEQAAKRQRQALLLKDPEEEEPATSVPTADRPATTAFVTPTKKTPSPRKRQKKSFAALLEEESSPSPAKKRARGGSAILEERALIKDTKDTAAKYAHLCAAVEKYKSTVRLLRASDQTFYHSIRRLQKCVETCHNGDLTNFMAGKSTMAVSKFRCSKCK